MQLALGYIFLLVVILAFVYAIFRPWLAFVLIIAFPVIEQALQGYFPILISYLTLFNYLIAGLVATTLALQFVRVPNLLKGCFNPVAKSIILVQAMSFASLLWTPDFATGYEYTVNRIPYTLLYMIMAPLLLTSLDDFRRIRVPLMILSCLALFAILIGPSTSFYGYRLMLNYTLTERANAGAFGDLGVLVLIVAALTTQSGVGRLVMPFQFFCGSFGFGMGLLSGARGQVLFGMVVAFLFIPVARRIKSTFGFLGIGIGSAALVGLLVLAAQLFITSDTQERWSLASFTDGFQLRFIIVSEAMKPWLQNPLSWMFGRGAGAFSTTGMVDTYPHNYIVEAITELGLVGFIFYMMVLYFTAKAGIGLFRRYRDDGIMRSPVAILCAFAVFYFAISLKQGTVHDPGLFWVWYLVIARLHAREADEPDWEAAEPDLEDGPGDDRVPDDGTDGARSDLVS